MRAVLAALTLLLATLIAPPAYAAADTNLADTNLAAGKTATASSSTDVYTAANVTDGNQNTYWESANNAFPQWIQIDLGATATLSKAVLKLPTGWPSRTQTLTVQAGATPTGLTTLVPSATYTLNPTATITFTPTSARYLRLQITANTGWPAGQLSELEIWGSAPDDPGNPGGTNLATGKPITESSHTHTYVAANANDNNLQTYWEGAAYP
ncbi:discoidin domain-containing protein, partial [Nonomuraea rosea]|uniref:discoidin domain-containing protein n=1 Tax=Nonomuraea rosea TaxID=638574 RepID=UPI0031E97FB9